MCQEVSEQAEFDRGKMAQLPIGDDALGFEIDVQIADAMTGGRGRGLLHPIHAAQDGLKARRHFTKHKRFGDVVVGAHVETLDDIIASRQRCEHDDGYIRDLANLAQDLKAIDLRHHDIQNHHIQSILLFCKRLQRLLSVLGANDIIVVRRKTELQQVAQGGFVFGDEDSFFG